MKNQKETLSRALTEKLFSGYAFEMIHVEGGTFRMGSAGEDAYYDEQPVHEVKLDSFHIGKYPVSQALWNAVMTDGPALPNGDARPVEMVSCMGFRLVLSKAQ